MLLVVNTGSNSVTKIKTATNTVTTQTIVVGKGPSSIAVSADSATAYVTNATDNSVTVITLSVNSTKTVAGVGSSPTSAVFSGGKVYVGNLDGTVTVIATSVEHGCRSCDRRCAGAQSGAQCRRYEAVRGHP